MNNRKIEQILSKLNNITMVDDHPGYWVILFENFQLHIITDESANRMRIIAPVKEIEDVSDHQLITALKAHFNRALDIKYAIYDEKLWVVYMHYLKELTKDMFIDAMSQVYHAANNFGTSYSSSNLFFGAGDD